ncbi:MAG TPA: hypothetical protein PK158_01795 [Spirochaetota bacterium]|nr:hypothetical protein [Spirochaetota bacterium]
MKRFAAILYFITFLISGIEYLSGKEDSLFFSSARISADTAFYLPNNKKYSGSLTNFIEINIYKRKIFSLLFSMNEKTIYGGKEIPKNRPYTIQYLPIEFLYARFDTGMGYFGIIIDHECFNYCGKFVSPEDRYRWYGTALKWNSYGMNVSEGNYPDSDSISFNPRLKYSLYAGRKIATIEYPYRFIFRTDVRLEIANIYGFFPYVRAFGYFTIDDSLRVSRIFETGFIRPSGNVFLMPYVRYSYFEDIDYYKCPPAKYFSAGLNIETLFSLNGTNGNGITSYHNNKSLWFPSMHFSVGYGREFQSSHYGNTAEGKIAVDIFSINHFTAYCENYLIHRSPVQITMMYPWRMEYSARGGLFIGSASSSVVFYSGYEFTQNVYGNDDKTIPEKHHSAFISAGSPGLYPRTEYDYCAFTDKNNNFPMNILWKIEAAKYFKKENFAYDYLIKASLEQDFFYSNKLAIYILPSIGIAGKLKTKHSYSAEFGLKYISGILFNPYIKFADDMLSFEGNAEKEKFIFAGFHILR